METNEKIILEFKRSTSQVQDWESMELYSSLFEKYLGILLDFRLNIWQHYVMGAKNLMQ